MLVVLIVPAVVRALRELHARPRTNAQNRGWL